MRPCLGQGASQGEESVLADSGREGEITARGWVGEMSELFEHPAGRCQHSFSVDGQQR